MNLILVRHAAVEPDPDQPPSRWHLSDAGRAAARALGRDDVWRPVGRLFTSPEWKAHETAQIIAGMNGIAVTVVEDLREVARPAGRWFDDDDPGGSAAAVADYFAAPNAATHGWEPPVVAQARIRACIDWLRIWEPLPFGVVGHGLTLSLSVASLTGARPGAIWPAIACPDLAVIDQVRGTLVRPFRGAADD